MFFVIDNSTHPPRVLYPSDAAGTIEKLNKSKKFVNRTVHEIPGRYREQKQPVHHTLKVTRFEVVYKAPGKPDEVVYSATTLIEAQQWACRDAEEHFSTNLHPTSDGLTTYFLTAYNLETHKYHWTVRPSEYAYCQESLNNA